MTFGDWDLKSTFDRYYVLNPRRISKPQAEVGLTGGYLRAELRAQSDELAPRLVSAFGLVTTDTIGIHGAGYGWLVESLEALAFTLVVGADISTWIQDEHDNDEEPDIDAMIVAAGMDPLVGRGALHKAAIHDDPGPRGRSSRKVKDEDGLTQGSRNRLKSSVGLGPQDNAQWVFTEYLIEILEDAEVVFALPEYQELITGGNNAPGQSVVHIIQGTIEGDNAEPGNWKGPAGWRAFLDANGASAQQIFVGPTGEVL